MKRVLGQLIAPRQTTFIPGRQILDVVVVINEIVYLEKRGIKECMMLKVDFEKAYDWKSWNYLRYMLKRLQFGVK